ncbi:MAG: 50S ribosomal protein L24 [Bdellovibrionales bacterium]|nr:50S ribosomal protein L24 [Bdellovibrionales bacterium]
MAKIVKKKCISEKIEVRGHLRKGDLVMVIAGGNKKTRPNKGQVGRILGFTGKGGDRVIVEGVNLVTKHKRATAPGEESAKRLIPAGIHISNVMYYVEKDKRPVRLKSRFLDDGRKVRGYLAKTGGEFVQV